MFSFIINFLEPFACLLYLIALVIYRRTKKQAATQILTGYYIAATLLLLAGSVAVKIADNNIWSYDLMAILTSVCLGAYFYRILQSPVKKKTVLLLIGVHLLYAIVRNVTLEGDRIFDSIGYAILSASISVYVFMYFHQLLNNVTETSILSEINFWLSSGYLIYFVGNFIIFVSFYHFTNRYFENETEEMSKLLSALWGMHNVLLFVSALLLLTGSLWITYRKRSA